MNKHIRVVALFLVLMMMSVFVISCGNSSTGDDSQVATSPDPNSSDDNSNNETDELEDITFTLFVPDPNHKPVPEDAVIAQQIYEKTKVRIETIAPPAEPEERLNVMLSTDDLPDLISFWDETLMNKFIAADKVLPLNDLMEEHAPNTLNINWKDLQKKIQDENGTLWFMPGGYSISAANKPFPETDVGLIARTNFLEEKGWYEPETFEDYYNLLLEVKEKYPDMYPSALALGPQGQQWTLNWIAGGSNGLTFDGNFILQDDELVYFSEVPEYKEFYQFLNKLYREDLMDPESIVMSHEMLKTKCTGRQVWSFLGQGWEIWSQVIAYEVSKDSNEQMRAFFPKFDEDVTNVTYAPYTVGMHTTGMVVTKKCKDPARFMKFYEFMNTEEGHLTQLGVIDFDFTGENTVENTEGYDYVVRNDMEEFIPDRKFIEPSAWMTKSWADDENFHINRGLEGFTGFTYSGNHPNGKYDVVGDGDVSIWWDENTTRINNEFGWTGTNYWDKMREISVDTSAISALNVEPDSDEHIVQIKIDEYLETQIPRIIVAENEAEFDKAWNEMNTWLKDNGVDKLVELKNSMYKERMEIWSQ